MRSPLMDEALELARQGLGRTSPNPVVGAVLVNGGEIVGRGFHTYAQAKHAEVLALEEAGDRARGATLYITLEPCSHHGRTPPCADALIGAGVSQVIAAMEDPNPQVAGQGFRRLQEAGVAVEVSTEYSEEAARLNEAFIHCMRTGLPLVTLKAALTLDGKRSGILPTPFSPASERYWPTIACSRIAPDRSAAVRCCVSSPTPRCAFLSIRAWSQAPTMTWR
jgi:diaminohydroxyphosphoribosylaminopyrimidine deaminase / 5-amino-6-(5-phosphoribosylamino)uracil reductase